VLPLCLKAQSRVKDNAIYLPFSSNVVFTTNGTQRFEVQDNLPREGIYKIKCNAIVVSRNNFTYKKSKHKSR